MAYLLTYLLAQLDFNSPPANVLYSKHLPDFLFSQFRPIMNALRLLSHLSATVNPGYASDQRAADWLLQQQNHAYISRPGSSGRGRT